MYCVVESSWHSSYVAAVNPPVEKILANINSNRLKNLFLKDFSLNVSLHTYLCTCITVEEIAAD